MTKMTMNDDDGEGAQQEGRGCKINVLAFVTQKAKFFYWPHYLWALLRLIVGTVRGRLTNSYHIYIQYTL
jgi:hypothetical protein